MFTQAITIKIDKKMHKQLISLANKMNTPKSSVVRLAIQEFVTQKSPNAGQSLVQMAKEAKKYNYDAPEDIIENLNKYLYGKS